MIYMIFDIYDICPDATILKPSGTTKAIWVPQEGHLWSKLVQIDPFRTSRTHFMTFVKPKTRDY